MRASDFAKRCRMVVPNIRNQSYRDALKRSLGFFRGGIAEVFSRRVDASGVPWPPRKTNPPNPMLIRTGAMYDAATGQQGFFENVSDHEAHTGIMDGEIPYAKFHQHGTKRMARRQFFYLPKRRLESVRIPIKLRMQDILVATMKGEL